MRRHQLTERAFDLLATGAGDRSTIRALRDGQRSRRLLLLRAVRDVLSNDPGQLGPLPPIKVAWELLVSTERARPDIDEPILHPHTGTWAGHLLRRARGVASDPAPSWVTAGYLHGLAAAAAIRAGIDFDIRVPAHDGVVVLPTLGFAWLPSQDGWQAAEVRSEAGRVRIRAGGCTVDVPPTIGTDGPGWFGLRQLRAELDDLTYVVALDDLDPYREAGRAMQPRRLSEPEVDQWRQCFEATWALLVRRHREQAVGLPAGLTTIVPRPAVQGFRIFSGTTEESFGSAMVSLPPDPATFAVTLLHEFQHTKLAALQHLVPLYEGGGDERLYAPWRPDPRGAPSLLQGVYAFLAVAAFWRTQRQVDEGSGARFAQFEYAHWRGQTWRTWQVLRARPGLTELGHRFVKGMGATMEGWQDEYVPADIHAAADAVAADHRATWRIRHVRSTTADVERLADAFLTGQPRPVLQGPESVVEAASCRPMEARAVLTRLRVADQEGFRERLRRPPMDELADLVPGDVEYLTGNYEAAIRTYGEQVRTDSSRFGAWVGLGLATAAAGRHAAASALLQRPELVLAVFRELLLRSKETPPDPVALADWLGR